MVKLVAFFRRKAGISADAFQEHWRTRHAELVLRQAGIRRYVQNHAHASGYRNRDPLYDGVAEAWFDSTEDMRALGSSAEYRAVREDEANFIDPESMGALITNEVLIVDGPIPKGGITMISFLNKREDVSVDFFQRHWREEHGPIAAEIPGMRRYAQSHVRPGIYAAGRTPLYDGVPLATFDGLDALRDSGSTPEYARTRADEANFMVSGRLPFVVTEALEIEV